jgi:hypothetical protein
MHERSMLCVRVSSAQIMLRIDELRINLLSNEQFIMKLELFQI